ncbi:hypothetical protein Peur_031905 [Populus x canadensis]
METGKEHGVNITRHQNSSLVVKRHATRIGRLFNIKSAFIVDEIASNLLLLGHIGLFLSFPSFFNQAIQRLFKPSLTIYDFANAPIHTGEDICSLLRENYLEVLKMGFLMNWTAYDCSTCERSGGRCGFENNEFNCFCRNGPRLKSCDAEQSDIMRQIAIVGLWCILTNPSDRPSMRKVMEMLEGPLGALKIPPKPRLYSPPRLLSYSSTTSLA